MCEHEGQACPGSSCRCECMTCMFGDEPVEYAPLTHQDRLAHDEYGDDDPIYLSELYSSEMENPL